MKNALRLIATLMFFSSPALAQEVSLTGHLMQGGMVVGTVIPGSEVTLGSRKLSVDVNGGFVFGFTRDAPSEATLKVVFPDGHMTVRTLDVASRDYNIQRIDGLPQNMVSPPQEVLDRIRGDNAQIGKARSFDTEGTWYRDGFEWPAIGPISGVYGSQRILNGQPKQPHYGIDVAAPEGTPVKAPAGGIVRLAESDHYYTGGTVIIDHGHGITSAFLHMRDVRVTVGQEVKTGDVIALLSGTGRATGPHLDWRVNWFGERLDAGLLVGEMPKK